MAARQWNTIPPATVWILLLFATCAGAQTGPEPTVTIRVQPPQATVGDPIRIDLEVTAPIGSQVVVRNPGNRIGDFDILEFHPGPNLPDSVPAGAKPAAGGTAAVRHSARILAAVYRTGDFEVPAIPISVRGPDGRESEIRTQPVKVHIASVLAPEDKDTKDLKKQADLPEPVRWLLYAAIAGILALLAGVAYWLWRRRRRPAAALPERPRLDPIGAAEAELRDLLRRGLLQKGMLKPFYVALAEIVKKAIEEGFGVPTIEKTTSEIADELRECPRPPQSDTLARIESLLLGCDMVKFAKYHPPEGENDAAVKTAFQVIEDCRRSRTLRNAPVAEPA